MPVGCEFNGSVLLCKAQAVDQGSSVGGGRLGKVRGEQKKWREAGWQMVSLPPDLSLSLPPPLSARH